MAARSVTTTCSRCLRTARTTTNLGSSCLVNRQFSTSSSLSKTASLPVFHTTNTQLSDILDNVRNRIFFPSQLTSDQKKLVFRTSNRAMLINDPLFVDVGEERHQLVPLDMTRDIPDSWGSVMQAVKLMAETGEGWNNLLPLLEGMKAAGRHWKPWQFVWIVRQAGASDQTSVILECLRATKRTGLSLKDIDVTRTVLWALRTKAVLNEWSEESVAAALRYAEQIAILMELEEHQPNVRSGAGKAVRSQPEILGAVLELAAVHAQQTGGDARETLSRYTQRLVQHLEAIPQSFHSTKEIEAAKPGAQGMLADDELLRWVPVQRGLKLLLAIEENVPSKSEISKTIQALDQHVEAMAAIVKSHLKTDEYKSRRLGYKWYEASS